MCNTASRLNPEGEIKSEDGGGGGGLHTGAGANGSGRVIDRERRGSAAGALVTVRGHRCI